MTDQENIKEETGEEENFQAKCEEYLSGWKRALADYDNLKKDLGREKSELRRAAAENAVYAVLPVLDNFDQAVKFVPENIDPKLKNWLDGILYVRTQLENVLKEMGAEPYGSVGDAFDPNLHEGAGEREAEGVASGSVLEVAQRGWKMGERVVRPTKVILNK